MAFGVAVPVELSEVADEICNQSVMKPLERKRFLALLRPEQFSALVFAWITTHLHIHLAGMRANIVSVPQHSQHTQQKFEWSFTRALARSSVRLVSVAALRAHLVTYRIHSAVKNVIPKIQVPFLLQIMVGFNH